MRKSILHSVTGFVRLLYQIAFSFDRARGLLHRKIDIGKDPAGHEGPAQIMVTMASFR